MLFLPGIYIYQGEETFAYGVETKARLRIIMETIFCPLSLSNSSFLPQEIFLYCKIGIETETERESLY